MTASQLNVASVHQQASAPLSDVEILARIDERLPRYTSYPTAPHFDPQIDADAYASWLDSLDAKSPVSLYLHVPFCEQLCHYCGCHTTVAHRPDRIAHYAQLLLREVDLVADAIGRRQTVSHVHWGGGTPTALAAKDFTAIADGIGKRFHIDAAAEIAVEIDPRHVDRSHVDAFADAGVNRASLGVQDFDPDVQKAIGRIQSLDQTARAVQRLRRIGVGRISFDLMYGLPHQTELSVASSVATALTLQPSRISLFGYAHVPWMKKHQELIPADALPGPVERLRQARAAETQLARAGYVAIGLDHFAKADDPLAVAQSAGRLHRNFQGYTTDEAPALIGLGASSIGFLPQGYVQNSPNLKLYREAIERGHLATARGFALTDDDRLRRRIIERLMCDLTVDLAGLEDDACTAFAAELQSLADLAADGLVIVEGTRITVPQPMHLFIRKIAAVFDTYLQRSETRHSRAV
jgi:oxygen-independent coproporphyrinogen III oxidase